MLLYFCGWANLAYSQNPVEPKPDPGLRITKVDATENDKVSAEFDSLMNRINTMRQMPEYMLDREFKGLFIEGPTKILEKARALIDRAERDGTQTPEQVLVKRIYMILDEASIEDQERQAKLLEALIASQPVNYIRMLGSKKFFADKRYRPAIACLNHYLLSEPNDVSIRLKLAVAYNEVGLYDEADRTADYLLGNKRAQGDYGDFDAYSVKAIAALGRKDYRRSISFAGKAFDVQQKIHPLMIMQLAAAQSGELGTIEETTRKIEDDLPPKIAEMKLEIDAVKAYALVNAMQTDMARQLVRQWKELDRSERQIITYWRKFPGGMDVANNWIRLMKN
jgi:tetratricopeptide (TPR) repeat protein